MTERLDARTDPDAVEAYIQRTLDVWFQECAHTVEQSTEASVLFVKHLLMFSSCHMAIDMQMAASKDVIAAVRIAAEAAYVEIGMVLQEAYVREIK